MSPTASATESALEVVVIPGMHDLGDGFQVRRALPTRQRRMVGSFVFLDQMGPHTFAPGQGLDVRPHPHIGLATVTYLFSGEIEHRDSIGNVQTIRPGDVNLMTAGNGVAHSERTPAATRAAGSTIAGLQCWVALPREQEETAPAFTHTGMEELPVVESQGMTARIVAGHFFGKRSPVATMSDWFFVDLQLQPGAQLAVPAEYAEQALYITEGRLDLGADGIHDNGTLLVLKPETGVTITAGAQGARVVVLGGEPLDGPRYLAWNFVSSSMERIEQAKEDWRQQRFAKVPGETEFIPLPEFPGRPVQAQPN